MDACVSIRHTWKPENPAFLSLALDKSGEVSRSHATSGSAQKSKTSYSGRTEQTVNPSAARVEVEKRLCRPVIEGLCPMHELKLPFYYAIVSDCRLLWLCHRSASQALFLLPVELPLEEVFLQPRGGLKLHLRVGDGTSHSLEVGSPRPWTLAR